ncbi:hypothetical protein DDZ13_13550 [Coraliomargarita sinensis]|uniref:Uncharacterized protein n=1 Tax=Coraliomargarita sinensis TaxID=2174842 RepID=A0A317ZDG2_9BACT|nr:hypothetical protein [Coraliomargarita sinensis]PXA03090.1 hypothetical protein DDZ13_13550 [Coraliomargarita sinensis]
MRRIAAATHLLFAVLLFSACASVRQPSSYIANLGLNSRPIIGEFDVCDSAGCRSITGLSYTPQEWQTIAALFEPKPESPAEERERINIAIGAMETMIGAKNDTLGDAPKNKRHLGTGKQIDCIAEAANTTVALLLLQQDGLLRYHTVGFPKHRGFTRLRFPHNTASVTERKSGDKYVIDSWFFAGGEPSISVPVSEWKAGYDPHKDPDFTVPSAQ